LLEVCRPHLLALAERELDADLRAKASASDLVQETCLDGFRGFSRFLGGTEGELRAWLCRVLLNNVADLRERYREAGKRQVSREEPIDRGAADRKDALADDTPSPSSRVRRREEEERVETALARLSEEHRQVIRLRNREHLPFAEVAKAMNRSEDAVQKLWARAIQKLREALEAGGP
jgi:RNA polymerase sigma-70 factor (subfamily 1)